MYLIYLVTRIFISADYSLAETLAVFQINTFRLEQIFRDLI